MRPHIAIAPALGLAAMPAAAEEMRVKIDPDPARVTVPTRSGEVEISRIQDRTNEVSGEWARTARPCPGF